MQDARQLPLISMAGLLLHGLSVRITVVAGSFRPPSAGVMLQDPSQGGFMITDSRRRRMVPP
jgi:hypothetical protein